MIMTIDRSYSFVAKYLAWISKLASNLLFITVCVTVYIFVEDKDRWNNPEREMNILRFTL